MPQDHAPADPDTKTEWAENRTDWAEDRTVLANERTFAGWMRTGMACIALAVGLKAIFGEVESAFYPARVVATLFCVIAAGVFWIARRKSCDTVARLKTHGTRSVSSRAMTAISAALIAGAAGTTVLLWLI
ncbi:YidH family protein [Wenxinia saemankumensis]|uniref:Putative membrane protein n=1 Tax=Wenxinia saemankumensis TaxID=1447782 RepID=A0A1M6DV12_9RHOB|nr:DUF202 domain-containing protein [Wenxinia saemankumensis]SHI76960.1 putative membrane protein [Wenxinia saemankumensis]